MKTTSNGRRTKKKSVEKNKIKTQFETKCDISRGMLCAGQATASLRDRDPSSCGKYEQMKGELEENSEEISSVALLSPACSSTLLDSQ